jgi:hypothetical protein
VHGKRPVALALLAVGLLLAGCDRGTDAPPAGRSDSGGSPADDGRRDHHGRRRDRRPSSPRLQGGPDGRE